MSDELNAALKRRRQINEAPAVGQQEAPQTDDRPAVSPCPRLQAPRTVAPQAGGQQDAPRAEERPVVSPHKPKPNRPVVAAKPGKPKPSPAPRAKGSSSSISSLTSLDDKSSDSNNNASCVKKVLKEKPAVPVKNTLLPVVRQRISYVNVHQSEEGTFQLGNRGSYEDSGKSSTLSEEHLAEENSFCAAVESDEGCKDTGPPPLAKRTPVPVIIPPSHRVENTSAWSHPEVGIDSDDSDYEPVAVNPTSTVTDLSRRIIMQGLQKQLSGSEPQLSTCSSAVPPLPSRSTRKVSLGGEAVCSVSTPPPPLPPRQMPRAKSSERLLSDHHPAPHQPAPHQPAPHQPAPHQPAPHQPAPPLPPRNNPLPTLQKARSASPPPLPGRAEKTKRATPQCHGGHPIRGMNAIIQPPSVKKELPAHHGPHDYLPMDKSSKTQRSSDYIADNDVASVPVRMRPSNPATEDPFPEFSARHDSSDDDYLLLLNEEGLDSPGSNMFDDEPLYQIYHQAAVMRGVIEGSAVDEDEYEAIYDDPDAMRDRFIDLIRDSSVTSDPSILKSASRNCSSVRKLWSETPQVINSGVLSCLAPEELKLQESLYEILASEASYLKSLKVLIKEFIQAPQLSGKSGASCVLTSRDQKELFSNVKAVRDVSVKVLKDLEALWSANCMLKSTDFCAILGQYALKEFDVYVKYCSNQRYQGKAMERLKANASFCEVITGIEQRCECKGLTMQSFLMLPMQRATRLPLLMDAVCHRIPDQHPDAEHTKLCLHALQKLVKSCNEGAKRMENIETLTEIDRKLKFGSKKKIPLVSETRCKEKEGSLVWQKQNTSILGKVKDKFKRESLYLFVFNDLLIITRKKSDCEYVVEEYAPKTDVRAEILSDEEVCERLPGGAKGGSCYVFVLSIAKKPIDYILSCKTESDCTRWVEAIIQPEEKERIYDDLDCPQVQAIYQYVTIEPDELSLEESDIINVSKKMPDGWYEGMRLRDGERGWFPANHTIEIASKDTRAKNLRQKFRLLESAHQELQ